MEHFYLHVSGTLNPNLPSSCVLRVFASGTFTGETHTFDQFWHHAPAQADIRTRERMLVAQPSRGDPSVQFHIMRVPRVLLRAAVWRPDPKSNLPFKSVVVAHSGVLTWLLFLGCTRITSGTGVSTPYY